MTSRTATACAMLAVAAGLVTFASPAAASAATPAASASDAQLTDTAARFSLDAFDDVVAWSRTLPNDQGYELVLHRNGQSAAAPGVGQSSSPISADLGRAADGGVEAVYERCVDEECTVYRYDLESGKERRLRVTGSSRCLDGAHAIWKGRIAFVREQIPTLRGKCPNPGLYVRSRRGALKRLRGRTPADLDLRGDRIVYGAAGAKRAGIYVDSIATRTGDFRLFHTRARSADGRKDVFLVNPQFAGSRVVWRRVVRRAGRWMPTYEDRLLRARPTKGALCEGESRNFADQFDGGIVDFSPGGDRIFYLRMTTNDEYRLGLFEMTDPPPSFSRADC